MRELKKGIISELQEYVAEKIKERGFEDETLHERLLLLIEEVGELAKASRKRSGMYVEEGKDDKHQLGEEIADVINMIFAVGIELELDMEKEFLLKESENDKRSYKRAKK